MLHLSPEINRIYISIFEPCVVLTIKSLKEEGKGGLPELCFLSSEGVVMKLATLGVPVSKDNNSRNLGDC